MIPYIQDCRRVVEDDNGSQIHKTKHQKLFLEPDGQKVFCMEQNQWEIFNVFGFQIPADALGDPTIFEIAVNKIRNNINSLEESAIKDSSLSNGNKIRRDVIDTFTFIRSALQRQDSLVVRKNLSLIRVLLKSVFLFLKKDLFTIACISNDKSSQNHFFHGYLEWRWNYLILLLQIELNRVKNTQAKLILSDTQFEIEFRLLLLDLTVISYLNFTKFVHDKKVLKDLLHSIGCNCLFELWNNCIQLAETLRELHFFGMTKDYLKQVLDAVMVDGNIALSTAALADRLPDCSYFQRMQVVSEQVKVSGLESDGKKNFPVNLLCGLIIKMKSIELLDCGDLLKEAVVEAITTEPSEDKMRLLIILIAPVLLDYWEPNCDIISSLWTCIYKRINSAFHMQTAALDALVVSSLATSDFLSETRRELCSELNIKRSSFSNFLSLIYWSLTQLYNKDQRSQANRIIGRIFSKLNVSKLISLSERGLHNFSQLIITLGLACDLKETGVRLMDILLQMHFSKLLQKHQKIMYKTHIAMVTLFFNNNLDLTKYFERLILQQKDNSADSEIILKLLAYFIQNLLITSESYENGLSLLISPWVTLYIYNASDGEKQKMFSAFLTVTEKLKLTLNDHSSDINRQKAASQMLKSIFDYVLPSVKQNYLKQGNLCDVPKLAASLCLAAKKFPSVSNNQNILQFFSDINRPNVRYSLLFLKEILSSPMAKHVAADIILQNWIHFYLVLEVDDVVDFHELVLNLPEISKNFTKEALNEISSSKAPLMTFFDQLFRLYFSSTDFQFKSEISGCAERYLTNFEKWATHPHPEDITMRIYQFITKLLFQCAPMFYSKAKSSCFLNVAFQHFILTPNVMMGKTVSPIVVQAVSKAFSYLAELLVRMNYRQDVGLMEKLNHLIVKWTPLLKSSGGAGINLIISGYIRLLRKVECEAVEHVISKFCNTFLAVNGRMPGINSQWSATVLKAIVKELIVDHIRTVVVLDACLNIVLEHVIVVDESNMSRKILLEMLTDIMNVANTDEIIQSSLLNALKTNTKRRLIHYEKLYFNFVRQISRACPSFMKKFLPYLKDGIIDVENMLGVSRDSGLRNSLLTVEEILKKFE